MKDSTSSGNVNLNKCVRCGDCATGCNFGAKNSLDVNLLVRAQQAGAEIFSGATVLSIEKDGSNGWIVNSVHTNAALRKRDGEVLKIRARKVVLAAGTLGSTRSCCARAILDCKCPRRSASAARRTETC